MIKKILSKQRFTDILNIHCDLDLKRSNPIFLQDTPAYDAVLSNQVWLQTDQQFRRYNTDSHIFIITISHHCDFHIEHCEPVFLHDTLAYDAA